MASEQDPLLAQSSKPPPKPPRTVTFNTQVSTSSNSPTPRAGQENSRAPGIGDKLRRRHSQAGASVHTSVTKPGAQRTTKTAQKLKLLPDPDHGDDGPDEESGRDVYSQFTRIKDPTARRDAARLGKEDRLRLPRVTAYCTANAYRLDDLLRYLRGRTRTRGAAPKLIDECVYTPYSYGRLEQSSESGAERRYSDSALEIESAREQLAATQNGEDAVHSETADFDTHVHTPEVFLFNYGTVVIWGMLREQEERFLEEISRFETEKLGSDDVQTENFNFYYTRDYQARIYNDFISLRDKKNYMTKLAISHALSQSVKVSDPKLANETSLYEDLVDNTIETTKEIPSQIATTGKVNLSRKEINMQIGELFILRINIHLQGSVLDSPELMWAEPQLDPVYQAVRSYLEMDQRVGLLTERLDVIADLLAVLKDQLTHTHGESLEWIGEKVCLSTNVQVIVLIAMEILVAAVNIVVDVWAGGE